MYSVLLSGQRVMRIAPILSCPEREVGLFNCHSANAQFAELRAFGLANRRCKLLKQLGIGANDIALAPKNIIASLEIRDQTA